ncbi:MAG: GAF domain-containing protein [Chloroflexi bacterium]|nr:GAF domain-containing protein [Chloroflexota bacterium]
MTTENLPIHGAGHSVSSLLELCQMLHSRARPDEIVDALGRAASSLVPSATVACGWRESGDRWTLRAWREDRRLDTVAAALLWSAALAPVQALLERGPADSWLAEPGVAAECARRLGVSAVVVEPFLLNGRPEGALVLGSSEAASSQARDTARLLALQVSAALERGLLRTRLAESERLTRTLSAVYESARDISSQLGLDEALRALVQRARELAGTHLAFLRLLDPETNELVTRASAGALSDTFLSPRTRLDEGVSGLVIQTGKPLYVRDMLSDPRSIPMWETVRLAEGLRSLLMCPMHVRGRFVGVLSIANRHITEFSDEDEQLLVALANVAVVVVENARLYEEQQQALKDLRQLSEVSAQQNELLRRSAAIHEQLTQMVLHNRGIEAISQAAAEIVQNPVVVEDRFFRRLAASPSEERLDGTDEDSLASGGTPPEAIADPELQQFFRRLAAERRPLSLPAIPRLRLDRRRVVAPIMVDDEALGYVTVVERHRTLEELDLIAIEHTATILALELMRQQTALEVEDRLRGELLEDLLSGDPRAAPTLTTRALHLGLDLTRPHRLLLIAPLNESRGSSLASRALYRRLSGIVRDVVQDRVSGALVADRAADVAVLLPSRLESNQLEIARVVAAAIADNEYVRRVAGDVWIAIGGECTDSSQFGRSLEEAGKAHAIAVGLGWTSHTVCFDDLGLYRLLFRTGESDELRRFADDLLAPLIDYDRRHGTELIHTLETFLFHDCRVEPTARALVLHGHTLRYRLQRIEQLSGRSRHDLQWRQDLRIALAIRRLQADALSPARALDLPAC